jgi:hypothetical protein
LTDLSMTTTSAITRHWILNLARECRGRISDVVPFVEELHLNVRKVPGVTAEDYATVLLDLFDSGAIRVRSRDEEGSLAKRSDLEAVLHARLQLPPVSRMTFLRKKKPPTDPPAIIRDAPDLGWELTSQGGEEWESLALPDWNHFATILSDPESGEMWSSNFDLLMAELGWSRELNGVEIDRSSLNLELLHDYAITYWKNLPVVHHASFKCRWGEHGLSTDRPEPEWFQKWWRSRHEWYTAPWMLPGWPAA